MLPTTHSGNPKEKAVEIGESKKKTKWYQRINNHNRRYMTVEYLYLISLVLILYRLQTLSDQNHRILKMVNSMQSQFGSVERNLGSLVSGKSNQNRSPFDNTEPLEKSFADVLKTMKFPKQDSTDKAKPSKPQVKQSTSKTAESTLKVPIQDERFNAADSLKGASVDVLRTSSSSLNPVDGYDQTHLVLLDRVHSQYKAWCTNAETPILTINLAEFIKPTSVSFQHSKFNGTIPNGAPKTYDVVACLDFHCEKLKPLVSNCKYSNRESDETEQMCNISSHLDDPSIGKIQFRFRENYGNTKTTCVQFVRVYGETKTLEKTESEAVCTKMRWYYHNSYPKHIVTRQSCDKLYDNNCCSECPECCQECLTLLMREQLFIRKQVLKTVPKLQG